MSNNKQQPAQYPLTGEVLLKNGFELSCKLKREEHYELIVPNDFKFSVCIRHREGYPNFFRFRLIPYGFDRWLDSFYLRLGRSVIYVHELQSVFDLLNINIQLEP